MLEHTGLNKLDGFAPVYVINMERSKNRKEYIEDHFKKYGVSKYSFIEAVDGSIEDLSNFIINHEALQITKGEAACSISHLKAIESWLDSSDSEYAIIVEDDVSFETVDFWNFQWTDFLSSITKKYDILQLAIINNFKVNPRLHLREFLDWSASVYLIKRDYAKRLIARHKAEDKYVLNIPRHLSVSEGMLFGRSLCYSIPLFTYSLNLGSSLNESHIETVHKRSKEETMQYWKEKSLFSLNLI
jgi:GR25 family glycosyltransferase involved in LPS biosynthesis